VQEFVLWGACLIALLEEIGVPSLETARFCMDPERAKDCIAGRARNNTVRSHVWAMEMMRRWLLRPRGASWSVKVVRFIGYVHAAASEPSGPTVPTQTLRAIAWAKRAAGVDQDDRLSTRPEAQQVVTNVGVLSGVDKGPATRYLRRVAWLRLAEVWAVLHCDDRTWLSPQRLAIADGGLAAALGRARTTGMCCKKPELPLVASRECYMLGPAWSLTGFDVRKEVADFDRGRFLPRRGDAGQKVVQEPAGRAEAAAAEKAGHQRIPTPAACAGEDVELF
ncbi:unnamed protein product, partial [Prorocentrum cordatum]